MKMTVNSMKCNFMEPPRDIYGGNDRFKQLWRRSERYEVG